MHVAVIFGGIPTLGLRPGALRLIVLGRLIRWLDWSLLLSAHWEDEVDEAEAKLRKTAKALSAAKSVVTKLREQVLFADGERRRAEEQMRHFQSEMEEYQAALALAAQREEERADPAMIAELQRFMQAEQAGQWDPAMAYYGDEAVGATPGPQDGSGEAAAAAAAAGAGAESVGDAASAAPTGSVVSGSSRGGRKRFVVRKDGSSSRR